MLERVKRRLSRTKSVSVDNVPHLRPSKNRSATLTVEDEELISRLSIIPDDETAERAAKHQPPFKAARQSERIVFNNVEAGFLSLPTEILMFLQPYLAKSSEVALRHTCSRFFHLYRTPSFYLKGEELFSFLCMTERDQDPMQLDKVVCGRCKKLHPRSTFASSELKQPALDRDCWQVWLCPHKHMGFVKTQKLIRAGVESPFRVETLDPCSRCRDSIRNRSVADRPDRGTTILELENPKSESMLISKIALMQTQAPLYNVKSASGGSGMYKEMFQAKAVSDALQAVDFRLCSHLKLGDPYILSKFCRACISTQKLPPGIKGPQCISNYKREYGDSDSFGKCKGTCFTRGCKTKFMFQARESLAPDSSGRYQVWLMIVVYRWLGPLLTDGKDKVWREHASDHKDRTEMKKKWTEWEISNRARPCIPNWSISLLHPDDCNLR